jgi:hypothetical protein
MIKIPYVLDSFVSVNMGPTEDSIFVWQVWFFIIYSKKVCKILCMSDISYRCDTYKWRSLGNISFAKFKHRLSFLTICVVAVANADKSDYDVDNVNCSDNDNYDDIVFDDNDDDFDDFGDDFD